MKKQILVLDDNLDILEIVREVLAYEGFAVDCIKEAALIDEKIGELKPDLILLDYKLIDGNGAEICERLKVSESTQHIPIVIFSAYIFKEEDFKLLKCDAVLAKPFDLQELVGIVNLVLNPR